MQLTGAPAPCDLTDANGDGTVDPDDIPATIDAIFNGIPVPL
jgi:hypothetical protein